MRIVTMVASLHSVVCVDDIFRGTSTLSFQAEPNNSRFEDLLRRN